MIVRSSSLEWVVLRFGAVFTTDLSAMPLSGDAMVFEECTAERQPGADRRRPRRRVGMCGCDDGRRGRRDPADRRRRLTPNVLRRPHPGRRVGAGNTGCDPAGTPRRPRQRQRLVRHRLDGHHPGAGSVAVPALLVVRHDGRVIGEVLVHALLGPTARAGRSRGNEAPVSVLERSRANTPTRGASIRAKLGDPSWDQP